MKLEITIPTDLSEIKLSQYQKFIKIAKNNEDSEFLRQKMVQIFCNIDLKDVATIKYKQVVEITNNLFILFSKKYELTKKFYLDGKEFGFIPNLDEISTGEYIDLETYIVDWENINKVMAILYRPIKNKQGEKYIIEDYEGSDKYSEIMKEVSLDIVLGAYVFFCLLGNELLKSTISYLEENPQVMSLVSKHNLDKDGDGIVHYMHSLKEMSEDLMKLPEFPYTKASHF